MGEKLRQQVREAWEFYVEKRFSDYGLSSHTHWADFTLKEKPDPLQNPKFTLYFKTAQSTLDALENSESDMEEFFKIIRDVLSLWLDHKLGHSVTDPKIYRDFAAFWENDFFQDMQALNVKKPSILTRISEYVPECVDYIQGIIKNGYAYESNGSVYFNTTAFSCSKDHVYAKLSPWAAGNSKLLDEGEGDLAAPGIGKSNPNDFALWKASKSGEPFWDSPWGNGRPGWHIECSVMASAVLGSNMDIHSGGVDLRFPHHDNELAQSEAFYNCKQWVNYFLHAGHLHIENLKMSKSLKNFLSIKETLAHTSPAQFRLLFLMQAWDASMDYSVDSVAGAKGMQSVIQV